MADIALHKRDHTGIQHFVAAHEVLPSAPDWLVARRADALQRLERYGFPGSKDEDWKYTSARPILRVPFTPALGAHTSIFGRFLDPAAPRFVFVDGQVIDAVSKLADGKVRPASLKAAAAKQEQVQALLGSVLGHEPLGFEALNTAYTVDGLFLDIPDGIVLEQPLHLVHVHTGDQRMATLRNVVRVGKNAEVTLVEHYIGHGEGLTSAVTEIVAGDNARVRHVKLQEEHVKAFHVATLAAHLGRDAQLRSHSIASGAALSRTDIRVTLSEPGAGCELFGLYLFRGSQHGDHHTHVDHAAPHTTSHELYKGILDDTARGVFTGRVVVRPDAQQIDSVQRNNNLLLGDRAIANTRPQLEIHADDVKCAHGATVGRLDPEAEFYLRQRGLDPVAARGLLTWAFANEVLGGLTSETLRKALETRVWKWLGREGEAA